MMQTETTRQMQERFRANPDIFRCNLDLVRDGLHNEYTPPIAYCEHCNAPLEHWSFIHNGQDWWRPAPLRCTCDKASAYWRSNDAKLDYQRQAADREREKKTIRDDINRLMTQAGLTGRFEGQTLESFSASGEDPSIEKAIKTARYYAEHFEKAIEQGRGLYIVGKPGVGKTHIAAGIARTVMEQHRTPVMMLSMVDLLSRLRATYNDESGESEAMLMRTLGMVDLLIIDDLGKEHPTSWTLERVYQIIDGRYQHKKCVIVTTNYNDATLIDRLSKNGQLDRTTAEAIVSRLHEMCFGVEMSGRDHRAGGMKP